MKQISEAVKSIICIMLVILLAVLSSMRLMKIQIVGDENIITPEQFDPDVSSYSHRTTAARGEILDYNNNVIVTNKSSCNLVLQNATFPSDLQEGNKTILVLCNALKEHGYAFKDSLPISADTPYVFTSDDTAEVIENLKLNVYASAENCIDKLIDDYKIADTYSDEEKRMIAGVRYEMIAQEFNFGVDLVLAEDVDSETIAQLKELGNFYSGIEAVESSERDIVRGDILPHEIGTVGPIYAEEYDKLEAQGYAMNDKVGKSGIESALETTLRGQNGEEELKVLDGEVVDRKTITPTLAGDTVKLTVSGTYQQRLQGILNNFIANFQSFNTNPKLTNVKCGAIAVLDAKTGAVKGMATAPTYNLKDYSEHYDYFLNAENSPLMNRCTYGQYRPGSTFKTITATAGLNEGIITGNTEFYCGGANSFKYHGGTYGCTGFHGNISVRRAIEVSCNDFFYTVSDRLGIDKINQYATLYGLGSPTGIETGDAEGWLCSPETFAANGQEWYIGYVIQAGIGNQDCGMTPLQMAVVANTIANRGVRYKPYLVDSYHEFGSNELISETKPTIAETINLNYDYVYDYIIDGMIDASKNVPTKYSLSNLGFDVAIKTGTPQISSDLSKQNSFFIGFAPADKPEIAFAGVIEGGDYSKYMIRDIILEYQKCYGLNGVKPTETGLADEVRQFGTTIPGETATTTTSAVTTTTAVTQQYTVPETTVTYQAEQWTAAPTEAQTQAPETQPVTAAPETTAPPPETAAQETFPEQTTQSE